MKGRLIFSLVFFAVIAIFGSAYFPTSIVKTVADVDVPEVLGASTVEFSSVTFYGVKADRSNNSGRIWIQVGSTNDTAGAPIVAGGSATFTAPPGKHFTAAQFFIDVEVAADCVTAILTK